MSRTSNGNRNPLGCKAHDPPMPNKYTAHALALASAVGFIHWHWERFSELFPENAGDRVIEDQIAKAFVELTVALERCATQCNGQSLLSDATYDTEFAERVAEGMDVADPADLAVIMKMLSQCRSKFVDTDA